MAKKRTPSYVNAAVAGTAEDTVRRFGSGIKEHIVAHGGMDNETGVQLKRSLESVAQSKVNPDYQYQNLKQQAGFSAEIKIVARERAEEAISGKTPKTVRTDDIPGHVNDQYYDITYQIDANGNPVPHSSVQVKFVGNSPEEAVKTMLTKQYQKYHDNNVKISVPAEYYAPMKAEIQRRISSLEKQISSLKEQNADQEIINAKLKQLENCRQLDKNLHDSKLTNSEAMEARLHPTLSTAKDIVKIAHRSGVEQAKMGIAIGGGISIIRNAIALYKGDKEGVEAIKDIAVDTAGAAAVSYATGFGGAVIKGSMQNSSSAMLRGISKTNLPAYIATSTLEIGKTMTAYFKGDIDGAACLEELGEKGYGMVTSAMFAAVGQMVIPIPILGAMAGSMLGYALASASYHSLLGSLKEAKLAKTERIRIETECEEAVKMLQEYRQKLEKYIDDYLQKTENVFNEVFSEIKDKLAIGDADGYIRSINKITEFCGKNPIASNRKDVDLLMQNDSPIKF